MVGVDSTYLRADASMKSIVRRDTSEAYQEYLLRLAKESGVEQPTAEDARRLDRTRKKKTSNQEWASATDPEARIARLKDGRTRLSYKPELVADLETGAIIAAVVHPADASDTQTIEASLDEARENVLVVAEASLAAQADAEKPGQDDDDASPPASPSRSDPPVSRKAKARTVRVVADKGYYSAEVLERIETAGFCAYIPEPKYRHRRRWAGKWNGEAHQRRAYAARRRALSKRAKALHRRRGEILERPFAHLLETGALRRTRLRGQANVAKRFLIHAAAANLGLVLRHRLGAGTPRGLADALRAASQVLVVLCVLGARKLIRPFLRAVMDGLKTSMNLGRFGPSPFRRLLSSPGC
jgi:transposase